MLKTLDKVYVCVSCTAQSVCTWVCFPAPFCAGGKLQFPTWRKSPEESLSGESLDLPELRCKT